MARPVTKPRTTPSPRTRTAAPVGAWHEAFLADLAENCNVSRACRAAGIDRTTAYAHRRDDPAFAARWADALEEAIESLEYTARKRALTVSDTLAIFLLKAHRPDVYRERRETTLTGANGGPVVTETRVIMEWPGDAPGGSDDGQPG